VTTACIITTAKLGGKNNSISNSSFFPPSSLSRDQAKQWFVVASNSFANLFSVRVEYYGITPAGALQYHSPLAHLFLHFTVLLLETGSTLIRHKTTHQPVVL
jgi:hypothetical protein